MAQVWRLLEVAGVLGMTIGSAAFSEDAQHVAQERSVPGDALQIDYVGYRAARWETEAVTEPQNERPNKGGLIYVYFTNSSNEPQQIAHYWCAGKEASHWRLGGAVSWDRLYNQVLEPGQMSVLEINGVSSEFAEGKPFPFAFVGRKTWTRVGGIQTELREDPLQISLISVLPGMDGLEIHLRRRGNGAITLKSVAVPGCEVVGCDWVGQNMEGPSYAIAQVRLRQALSPAALFIVRVDVQEGGTQRAIYAHRRAFADFFPIGCWSNREETYGVLRQLHIDTVVRGGRAEDPFFRDAAPAYGFHAMVPVEKYQGVDTVRSLAEDPAALCWMLYDEPDWSTPAGEMLLCDNMTRFYNETKPTFMTLCRNVKFFEYAAIADIPCMDHYCVSAPSSSKWPVRYGTRLEETGYYTRDLKAACEPKPFWVWSQGIAAWGRRPQQPVPTPDELAAQLMLNLGRGAKGILWFNYEHEIAEKYPATRQAMGVWGRVLSVAREGLLASEPAELVVEAPDKVDASVLLARDRLFLCVTNLDYELDPAGYPFAPHRDVKVRVALPEWIAPAAAIALDTDDVRPVSFTIGNSVVEVDLGDLDVCRLVVLANSERALEVYQKAFSELLDEEEILQ